MPVYALVDANNFYVSCERVFRPDLEGLPVGVLSNNDGCFVSRSAELKALGVKMGQPFFETRDLVRRHKVHVFSSNYALYGDMSSRVVACLHGFTPSLEVYSIDESFLDLTGIGGPLPAYAADIRARVKRWTGIPTCVGIGPTKTLAKLANHAAKKALLDPSGVCDLSDPAVRARVLPQVPVADVWGVGRRNAVRLSQLGVTTAADLRDLDPRLARQALTVIGERLVQELRGLSCLSLDRMPSPRRSVAVTRSFGQPVTEWDTMRQAVASHAARAAEKLRAEGMVAEALHVFVRTSRYRPGPACNDSVTVGLQPASADGFVLIAAAANAARRIWRDGVPFSKAGVILTGLRPADRVQADLLDTTDRAKAARLMAAVDAVNSALGRNTLVSAATLGHGWRMRQNNRSPSYTTRLADLPVARA
ncbi:Y-family DNA polymerase [Azospirillum griseum]|uniref:DNA-directed DNA polymerase n=1 Tax=Azospirillum griseum TaxID=2496639 RepID=A0A431VF91_9PROT|nr:Y-family DNA polymerase [Azospirillum griseum]RTR18653.1 Y-family DNA polymerase [Azospirillum griseum]